MGKNIELFALTLIKNQKFGSFWFGRTLESEFGRTELSFDMYRTEPNRIVRPNSSAKIRPNRTFGSPLGNSKQFLESEAKNVSEFNLGEYIFIPNVKIVKHQSQCKI